MTKADKRAGIEAPRVRRKLGEPTSKVKPARPRPYGFSVERCDWVGNGRFRWQGNRWYQWYVTERARDQAAASFKRQHDYTETGRAALAAYRDLRLEQR